MTIRGILKAYLCFCGMRATLKLYGAKRIGGKRTSILSQRPLLAIFFLVITETVALNIRPGSTMMSIRIATATPVILSLDENVCNYMFSTLFDELVLYYAYAIKNESLVLSYIYCINV